MVWPRPSLPQLSFVLELYCINVCVCVHPHGSVTLLHTHCWGAVSGCEAYSLCRQTATNWKAYVDFVNNIVIEGPSPCVRIVGALASDAPARDSLKT